MSYDYDDAFDEELGALEHECDTLMAGLEDDDDDDEVGLFRRRRARRQRRRSRVRSAKSRGQKVRKIRIFKPKRIRKGVGFFGKKRQRARKRLGLRPGFRRRLGGKKTVVVQRRTVVGPRTTAPPRAPAFRPPGRIVRRRQLGVPLSWSQPLGAPGSARPGVPSFQPAGRPVGFGFGPRGGDDGGGYEDENYEDTGYDGGYEDEGYGYEDPGEEVEYVDETGRPLTANEVDFSRNPPRNPPRDFPQLSPRGFSPGFANVGALDDEIAALVGKVAKIKGKKKGARAERRGKRKASKGGGGGLLAAFSPWRRQVLAPALQLRVKKGFRVTVKNTGTESKPVWTITPYSAPKDDTTGFIALLIAPVASAVKRGIDKRRALKNAPWESEVEPGESIELGDVSIGALLIDSDGTRREVD